MTGPDRRIVYGATCSWWDSIDQTSRNRSGLPACPCCFGVLFECPDAASWWKGVDAWEAEGNVGYRQFVEWLRGRCFPGPGFLETARGVYDAEVNT